MRHLQFKSIVDIGANRGPCPMASLALTILAEIGTELAGVEHHVIQRSRL